MSVQLLTDGERIQLPTVLARRKRFQKLIRTSLTNYNTLFTNCLMISGRPGSGKTTLVGTYLDQLTDQGLIAGYKRASGHVTPSALYQLLRDTASPVDGLPQVLVLDDVDCFHDDGCLELMKAAFDTRSNLATNREVHYQVNGKNGGSFKFCGFGIIITNDNFLNAEENSVHLNAIMDRVQPVSCDLQAKDMQIFTTSLIEKYLNDNEDNLTEEEIQSVTDMFNTDFRTWMEKDAFRKAKINYSVRLVKKFVDAQRTFRDDWKDFNMSYRKLQLACQMSDLISDAVVTVKSGNLPAKNADGKFIDAAGNVYSSSMQCYYRRKEQNQAA